MRPDAIAGTKNFFGRRADWQRGRAGCRWSASEQATALAHGEQGGAADDAEDDCCGGTGFRDDVVGFADGDEPAIHIGGAEFDGIDRCRDVDEAVAVNHASV